METTNKFSPNNNPTDRFFSKMYFPILWESNGELTLRFSSEYNYDISIVITFDAKHGFLKGGEVIHEIKGWEYFIQDATEIGGFENNKAEFKSLMAISTKVVTDNFDLITEILSKPMTGICEGDKHFEFPTVDAQMKQELIQKF
jgi:hypothetical protein